MDSYLINTKLIDLLNSQGVISYFNNKHVKLSAFAVLEAVKKDAHQFCLAVQFLTQNHITESQSAKMQNFILYECLSNANTVH